MSFCTDRPSWIWTFSDFQDVLPAIVVHPYSPVRHPLRHLVAYGNTNMYKPVNSSKKRGSSGE